MAFQLTKEFEESILNNLGRAQSADKILRFLNHKQYFFYVLQTIFVEIYINLFHENLLRYFAYDLFE